MEKKSTEPRINYTVPQRGLDLVPAIQVALGFFGHGARVSRVCISHGWWKPIFRYRHWIR